VKDLSRKKEEEKIGVGDSKRAFRRGRRRNAEKLDTERDDGIWKARKVGIDRRKLSPSNEKDLQKGKD